MPFPSRYPGTCRCGARVAVGALISYANREVTGCPACDPACRPGGGQAEPVELRGAVAAVRWQQGERAILAVRVAGALPVGSPADALGPDGLVAVAGAVAPDLRARGACVRVSGTWRPGRDGYGPTLAADLVTLDLEAAAGTVAGVRAALDLLPEVGPVRAARLVEALGPEGVLAALEAGDLDALAAARVPGLTPERIAVAVTAWQAQRELARAVEALARLGVVGAVARRAIDRWEDRAAAVLAADPYLVRLLPGVGWATADAIGRRAGVAANDPRRLAAAAGHVLDACAAEGSTWATVAEATACGGDARSAPARAAAETGCTSEQLAAGLELAERERVVEGVCVPAAAVRDHAEDGTERVAPRELHEAEVAAARHLRRLLDAVAGAEPLPVEAADLAGLDPSQAGAVHAAARSGVVVITGGPGTGKTTTARRVLGVLSRSGEEGRAVRVVCVAPTGKAALRLAAQTGTAASTIHRALGFTGKGWRHDEDEPIEADVVLCDEASMVDAVLAAALLAAVRSGARLVVVGDVDQLPPVGPGAVLADLIESGQIPVARLTTIHRQASESAIPYLAAAIRAGGSPSALLAGAPDVTHVEADGDAALVQQIVHCAVGRARASGIPEESVQVLSPQRTGAVGVRALNAALQAALRPVSRDERDPRWVRIGTGEDAARAGLGDRVVQTRNDYDLAVFNGEIGTVRAASSQGLDLAAVEAALGARVRDGREGEDEDEDGTDLDGEDYDAAPRRARDPKAPPVLLVVDYGTAERPRLVAYTADDARALHLGYCTTVHKSQGSEYALVVLPLTAAHSYMLTRRLAYTAVTRASQRLVLVGSAGMLDRAAAATRDDRRRTTLCERLRALPAGSTPPTRPDRDEGEDGYEDEREDYEQAAQRADELAAAFDEALAQAEAECPACGDGGIEVVEPDEDGDGSTGACRCGTCGAALRFDGTTLALDESAQAGLGPAGQRLVALAAAAPDPWAGAQDAGALAWGEDAAAPALPVDAAPERPAQASVADLVPTHCAICGLPLRDAPSLERGIGPVCAERLGLAGAGGPADPAQAQRELEAHPADGEVLAAKLAAQDGDEGVRAAVNAALYRLSCLYSRKRAAGALAATEQARARALCRAVVALGYARTAYRCGSKIGVRVK